MLFLYKYFLINNIYSFFHNYLFLVFLLNHNKITIYKLSYVKLLSKDLIIIDY